MFVRRPSDYVIGNLLTFNPHTQRLEDTGTAATAVSGGSSKSGVLALTFGSTVETDTSANLKFTLAVTGAFTLDMPTGLNDGDVCVWTFRRISGAGDVTLHANFVLPLDVDGNPIARQAMATTAGHSNILLAVYDASSGKLKVSSFLEFAV